MEHASDSEEAGSDSVFYLEDNDDDDVPVGDDTWRPSSTSGTFFAVSGAIILKVYLDATATHSSEVPITPHTTVGDVLDCCKEPGEEQCHLAELWRGCERPVNNEERPYEILQQWGIHRDEVRFFLRHEAIVPDVQDDGRRVRRNRNGMREASQEDTMLPHGVDLTLSELQEMAARQQQQIEAQQQLLVAKEQRLRFLKQQELRHEQIAAENERLRKLREKVEAQELKLKKLRALRGQVSEHKSNNNNLTAELEMIKSLFNEKEKELTMAVNKVEELTKQLEELRTGQVNGVTGGDNKLTSPAFLELEKLRKELMVRNKLNEAQNSKLSAHREVMQQRKSEMVNMDVRIAELQQRLRKKRAQQQQQQQQRCDPSQQQQSVGLSNQRGGSMNAKIGASRPQSANIAAVEPYIKHVSNKDLDQQGYIISKQDPKYQTLPPNVKFPNSLEGRRADVEPNGNTLGYPGGEKRTDNGHVETNNNQGGMRELRVDTSESSGTSGQGSPGKSGLDLLPKEVVHRVPDYKPSKGHTAAFEAMEEVLKNSEKSDPKGAPSRSIYGPVGYKAPSGLSNVTPRPFGSTYSTAMLSNRPSIMTTQPGHSSPVPTSSMSSPGAMFPKTSTPITSSSSLNNADMKEIFITGAPTVPSIGGKQPIYNTASSGSQQNYAPVTVMTSAVGSSSRPSDLSPRSRPPDVKGGPPHYQIASSRPQQAMHPQRTRDPNSPPSGQGIPSIQPQDNKGPPPYPSVPGRAPKPLPSQSNLAVHPTSTPQAHFAGTASSSNGGEGRVSAPGQFSVSTSTKVNLSEHHPSNAGPDRRSNNGGAPKPSEPDSNKAGPVPGAAPTQGDSQAQPLQRQGSMSEDKDKDKLQKDITATSVSSALTILMSGPSTTTATTRPFRYAPKSVIANTYMRKLGSNTLEEYRKNMNQLYKEFVPSQTSDGGQQANVNEPEESAIPSDVSSPKDQVHDIDYPMGDPDTGGHPASKAPSGNLHRPSSPRKLTDSSSGYSQWGPSTDGPHEGQRSASPTRAPPPYRGAPPYDIDAERMRYKPSAPKMLRRRLSSSESDDLNKNQTRSPPKSQTEGDDLFSSPHHSPTDSQNVVRVDTIQDSYSNHFSSGESNQEISVKIAHHSADSSIPHGDGEPLPVKQAQPPGQPGNQTQLPGQPGKQAQPPSQPGKEHKPAVIRRKKTNLKTKDSIRSSRRVSFDPLALLLDASLEGELELVIRTAQEVPDPSAANDEGITALHNGICAGHYDIVKFLAEFGCNVNAPDSDGWTPLHCAASCNNLAMVKLLVEHGACIFATTISDHETAAEKCEEDEDGYDGCSEYLYSVQEKLGIINKGVVYGVFDYAAQNSDELSFSDGNNIVVLRKGDEQEKDWWWARLGDREGYIPRNLLGLCPRVPLKCLQDPGGKHDS